MESALRPSFSFAPVSAAHIVLNALQMSDFPPNLESGLHEAAEAADRPSPFEMNVLDPKRIVSAVAAVMASVGKVDILIIMQASSLNRLRLPLLQTKTSAKHLKSNSLELLRD